MKLATHNSLSSYTPKKWWTRIFNPFAKCQSLTIEEQWDAGVRMFDIRVRPHSGEAAHGLISYDVDVKKIFEYLNQKGDIVVRLCCEDSALYSYGVIFDEDWFRYYFAQCVHDYPNITFCEGYMKRGWRKIINVNDVDYIEKYRTFNHYMSENGWRDKLKSILEYICHPFPKYWAEKDNTNYRRMCKGYDGYVMMDFVEIDRV